MVAAMRTLQLLGASLCVLGLVACGENNAHPLAMTASAETLGTSAPKSAAAKPFAIQKSQSQVGFAMDAPIEKIRGKVQNGVEGTLHIDPQDLKQTTGTISVDISELELFQQRKGEDGSFGEETKNETQNKHARQWLEIDPSTPEDIRKKNSRVEFRIKSIEQVSEKNVTKMPGTERVVTVKAKGDFLLHGRISEKVVDLEAKFTFDGDNIASLTVKTVSPFNAGLAEHDVHPRESFGVLAKKTLEVLSEKVARDALVSLELKAVPGDAPAAPPAPAASETAAPAESAAPAASADASAAPATSGSAPPPASAAPSGSAAPKKAKPDENR